MKNNLEAEVVKENAFEDHYASIIHDGGYSADFDLREH